MEKNSERRSMARWAGKRMDLRGAVRDREGDRDLEKGPMGIPRFCVEGCDPSFRI